MSLINKMTQGKVILNQRIYLRAEIQKYFRSFLVQMKKGKKSFQNYLAFRKGFNNGAKLNNFLIQKTPTALLS